MTTRLAALALLAALLIILPAPYLPAQDQPNPGPEDQPEMPGATATADEDLSFLSDNLRIPDGIKPEALAFYAKGEFLLDALERNMPFWGESDKVANHEHIVAVDGKADGRTDTVEMHFHMVTTGSIGPALHYLTGQELKDDKAHTHAVKSVQTGAQLTAPPQPLKAEKIAFGFGPVKAAHFNYICGLTDKGFDDHRHVVTIHFFGNGVAQKSADHMHVFRQYEDKGAAKAVQGGRALPFDKPHTHKQIDWCFRKFWLADAGEYIADLLLNAAKKDQNFSLASYKLSIIYQWCREFDLAQKAIDKAVRGIPNFYEAFVERGDVSAWLMDYDMAFSDYQRALRINPEYAHAHFCTAMTRMKTGEHDKASASFKTAMEGLKKEHARLLELQKTRPNSLTLKKKIEEVDGEAKTSESYIKQIEEEKIFPKNWAGRKVFESDTKHYLVRTSMSQEIADFFAERLELAHDLFTQKFQLKKQEKTKIRVYLFPNHKEYVETGAPPQSGGYSSPELQKIVFPIQGRDIQAGFKPDGIPKDETTADTRLVLIHEAFHQFLDKYLAMAPQNFNEGCADYFGPSEYSVSMQGTKKLCKLEIKVNPWRLNGIKDLIDKGFYVPLEPFLKQSRGEMYDPNFQGLHYAQAWGLFHFFWEFTVNQQRKYWDTLNKYYMALRAGKGLKRAYDDSFGRLNMSGVEEEWKKYIKNLK